MVQADYTVGCDAHKHFSLFAVLDEKGDLVQRTRVGVPFVQRVPTGLDLAVFEEIDQKRGLPVARCGRQEDQLTVEVFVEEVNEPRTTK